MIETSPGALLTIFLFAARVLCGTEPTIVTLSLPNAVQDADYTQTLNAEGTAPMTWSIKGGSLPPGLSLKSATGIISGTPAVAGNYTFTISAANAWGATDKQLSLTVNTVRFGINFTEAECSWGSFAGLTDLSYIKSHNIALIRLPVAWERLQPRLGGPLDPAYLKALKNFLLLAGSQGVEVIVDVHNYGRYNRKWAKQAATDNFCTEQGDVIGSVAVPITAFANLWSRLANSMRGTPGLAYYDLMNEPHDMGGWNVWPTAAQAAVNAIRAVDMFTPILVEGDQWASATAWPQVNANLRIHDPANKLLYEAHVYFDADGSSRYAQSYVQQGAYISIGADRVQPFLNWLKQNNARGFIGEFGVPDNDPGWLPVLDRFLSVLRAAGVSGTMWTYAFHSPSDPTWSPMPEVKRIILGQANPQMEVLSKYTAP